ncbi:MAG: TlpA family protein disulfide reductase [Bacteroidales bacterium]|nr:TlpA family protein disulfide reductase [Bacteroidales bacterium]
MKKIFYLIAAALLGIFFTSCSQDKRVVISIPEMSEGEIYVLYQDPDMISSRMQDEIAKTEIRNGKCEINLDTLSFEGKRKECSVTIINEDKHFEANLPLIVEKGKTIVLTIKGVSDYLDHKSILDISYSGSRFAEEFSEFWQKVNDSFMELSRNNNAPETFKKQADLYKDFIKKYPESGYAYSVLISEIQMLQDNDNAVMKYCEELVNEKSNNAWHKYFTEAYKYKLAKQTVASTLVFSGQDKDGKTFTERDVKGKLILIDFWASWCKPCIEALPKLKNLHNKYKDKGLTIVSISVDMNPNDWNTFIEKNPFEWLSVLGNGQDLTQRYDFQYIPYVLIADANGKILQKGIEVDKLEGFIDKYLE